MAKNLVPQYVLEVCLYTTDLDAAESFYRDTLGLTVLSKAEGRHVFFKLENQMLLIFNPDATTKSPGPDATLPVPPHGCRGHGHICFRASAEQLTEWKQRLTENKIPIEADFNWPGGGRSIYFRDPAGHCIEFAEPKIWGFSNETTT